MQVQNAAVSRGVGERRGYCRCGHSKAMRRRKKRYPPKRPPIAMARITYHCIAIELEEGE